ncbi:hypothetical protein FJZ53_00195 [Candidatus Woesearchaeota archaeon]|nr:hypothetical protein [Candidatus Woesearchaeota archaeon]
MQELTEEIIVKKLREDLEKKLKEEIEEKLHLQELEQKVLEEDTQEEIEEDTEEKEQTFHGYDTITENFYTQERGIYQATQQYEDHSNQTSYESKP